MKRFEVGEIVSLTGFAFDRQRKERRAITEVRVLSGERIRGDEMVKSFVMLALEGEREWYTVQGDQIPVGIGNKRFMRLAEKEAKS